MKRLVVFLVPIIFLIIVGFLGLRPGKTNIVLISIDTLRADHFTPEYMPQTYAWAKENGLQATTVRAAATWTKPSHVSILSGLTPEEHQVKSLNDSIPESITLLPEALPDYHRVAFTGGGLVSAHWRFDQGFDIFEEFNAQDDPWRPLKEAQQFLRMNEQEPFFLFVHCYGPHEYITLSPAYSGPIGLAGFADWAEKNLNGGVLRNSPYGGDAELKQWYQKLVHDCDQYLARLLEALPETTVFLVTSDHGEYLGEDWQEEPRYGHGGPQGPMLWDVPLLTNINQPIRSHTDIAGFFMKVEHSEHTAEPITLEPAMKEQLKALGYIQ